MRHDERGSALLITMLMVLALAVLGATMLSVSLTDRKIASNEADANKAFAVAEAGIEDARAALATTAINPLLAANGHLFTGSTVGNGTYVVDVTNNFNPHTPSFPTSIVPNDIAGGTSADTDRFLVINSTGTVKKASRRIEAIVRMPINLFNRAVWCDTGGTISGAGYVDAYNSNSGPYSGPFPTGNVTHDASLFCNGNLTTSGSSMIWGTCAVSDGTCDDPHVDGAFVNNAPTETRTPVACPAGGYPASMPGASSYNSATGDLTVSSINMDLAVPPTSYYFSQVTVSGGGSITLVNPSNLHVDIYVSGKVTGSGGSFLNNSNPPGMLGLWACGAGTQDWVVSGGSSAAFTIYAPTRKVTLSGTSPFFGAIVAGRFENSGGSAVHYDWALASSGIPPIVGRTWREIFP